MKLLALDSATSMAGVAAWQDGRAVAVRRARVVVHSDSLLTMVDEVLREAGWAPRALDGVACASGPGSFTGLRISLATAKGLCFAVGCPLVCVPTLQALAARAPDGRVCATLDAHKQEIYAAVYLVNAGLPSLEEGEWVLPPAELARRLTTPMLIVGDGVLRYPEIAAGHQLLDSDGAPHPADIARLAAERLQRGDSDDLSASGPHYVRASEAELARMKSR